MPENDSRWPLSCGLGVGASSELGGCFRTFEPLSPGTNQSGEPALLPVLDFTLRCWQENRCVNSPSTLTLSPCFPD